MEWEKDDIGRIILWYSNIRFASSHPLCPPTKSYRGGMDMYRPDATAGGRGRRGGGVLN
ncbi:hypothetical protein [Clostridium sp. D5]|uniref:hypothetical protein n=1 Tax=Clostridium sp. D5 TaxID=556261 RepID=UPI0003183778|nr:hypothetical protein [Clostridium sp. D5]